MLAVVQLPPCGTPRRIQPDGGKLTQQYVVDTYVRVEGNRMEFLHDPFQGHIYLDLLFPHLYTRVEVFHGAASTIIIFKL